MLKLKMAFMYAKLVEEQHELMRDLFVSFRDMFVVTSIAPGRTDLLAFSIDTDTHRCLSITESEIEQYLELGYTRPSVVQWDCPAMMIRKPDGGIRIRMNYRSLNAVTIKDCYPMAFIDDMLDVLGNSKRFPAW